MHYLFVYTCYVFSAFILLNLISLISYYNYNTYLLTELSPS
jgi:hypothetical protein